MLLPYVVRTEVLQLLSEQEKYVYFTNFWNIVDLLAIPLTSFLTINWLFTWILDANWIDANSIRPMAALASLLLTSKIFDWLRLFDRTAFYVQLLGATLDQIKEFMLLFTVALLTFGLPLSMLNQTRQRYIEDE